MKRFLSCSLIASSMILSAPIFAEKQNMQLKTDDDKMSYSIGVDIGKSFNKQQINIKLDSFMLGIKEGQQDNPTLLSNEEIQQMLLALQSQMIKKQQEASQEIAVKNKSQGDTFLSENKKRKEIKTTKSGLQYRVIKSGSGSAPKAEDTVTTHYRGTLIDGTEFDSSYSRGQPATFKVNGVIKGWTEALQMMQPGAKWELYVPSTLAYGEHGVGNIIGPNATLIFEVELVSVEKN
jgi:FKBP-type peptidyl-prolyl cis-trans isomerase FklB